MGKMGLNNKSYNAKYAKLLSFTLGNYIEMLDSNFRKYVIGETVSLFRKEDGLTDLGMLEKDFLSKDDISEEIKREILDGVFRTDEEYEQVENIYGDTETKSVNEYVINQIVNSNAYKGKIFIDGQNPNSQITTINENTIKNIVRETLHQLLGNM